MIGGWIKKLQKHVCLSRLWSYLDATKQRIMSISDLFPTPRIRSISRTPPPPNASLDDAHFVFWGRGKGNKSRGWRRACKNLIQKWYLQRFQHFERF